MARAPVPTPDPIVGPLANGAIDWTLDGNTLTLDVAPNIRVFFAHGAQITVDELFEGPLPASGKIPISLPVDSRPMSVTLRVKLITGAQYSEEITVFGPPADDTDDES